MIVIPSKIAAVIATLPRSAANYTDFARTPCLRHVAVPDWHAYMTRAHSANGLAMALLFAWIRLLTRSLLQAKRPRDTEPDVVVLGAAAARAAPARAEDVPSVAPGPPFIPPAAEEANCAAVPGDLRAVTLRLGSCSP
jgi:hypothetical protein